MGGGMLGEKVKLLYLQATKVACSWFTTCVPVHLCKWFVILSRSGQDCKSVKNQLENCYDHKYMYSHGHTRLEILGGWQESALFMLKAPGPIGGFVGMLSERNLIWKNSVFLMPFPGFLSGFLCIEQVTNEKKILGVSKNETKPKQEYCLTLQ